MQVTAGLIFERVIHNLANIAACRTADDGFSDKCDVACLPVDGTCNRDAISERDGCVGENVSDKGARGTVCDAATYLPVDATGCGTAFEHNFSIGPGDERGAHLKYVDATPVECQNTIGSDPSGRGELVHSWVECLASQINTCQVPSERYTQAIVVRRSRVSLGLHSGSRAHLNRARDQTRREASHGFDRSRCYVAIDGTDTGAGDPCVSDYGKVGSSVHLRTIDGASRSNS